MTILLSATLSSTSSFNDGGICHLEKGLRPGLFNLIARKPWQGTFAFKNSPRWKLNPGLPHNRRGYSPLYFRGLIYKPFMTIKHFSEIQNSFFLTGLNGNYFSLKFKVFIFSWDERKQKKRQNLKSFFSTFLMFFVD